MDIEADKSEIREDEHLEMREHWKVFGLRGAGVLSHPDEVIAALQHHSVIATQTVDGRLSHYLVSMEEWQPFTLADFDTIHNHSVTEWARSNLFNKIPPLLKPEDACIVGGRKNVTSGFVIIPGNAPQPTLDKLQSRRRDILGVGRTLTNEFYLALDTGRVVFGTRNFPAVMDHKSPRTEEFAVAVGNASMAYVREVQKLEKQSAGLGEKIPAVSFPGTRVGMLMSEKIQENMINTAVFSDGITTVSRWLNGKTCRSFGIVAGNDNLLRRLRGSVPENDALDLTQPS